MNDIQVGANANEHIVQALVRVGNKLASGFARQLDRGGHDFDLYPEIEEWDDLVTKLAL